MNFTREHFEAQNVTADDLHFYVTLILPLSGVSHVPAESIMNSSWDDGIIATPDGRPADEVDPWAAADGFWVDLAEQDRG